MLRIAKNFFTTTTTKMVLGAPNSMPAPSSALEKSFSTHARCRAILSLMLHLFFLWIGWSEFCIPMHFRFFSFSKKKTSLHDGFKQDCQFSQLANPQVLLDAPTHSLSQTSRTLDHPDLLLPFNTKNIQRKNARTLWSQSGHGFPDMLDAMSLLFPLEALQLFLFDLTGKRIWNDEEKGVFADSEKLSFAAS